MATFDPTEFFARQAELQSSSTAWDKVTERLRQKQQQVDAASQSKLATLEEMERRSRLRAAQRESLAGQVDEFLGVNDLTRSFAASLAESAGSAVRGAAEGARLNARQLQNGYEALGGQAPEWVGYVPKMADGLGAVADWLKEQGTALRQAQDESTYQTRQKSMPSGDLFSPSTWSAGEDPSLEGYAHHAADLAGQLMLFGATRGAGAVALGSAMAGGSQAEDAREYVDKLTDDQIRSIAGEDVDVALARRALADQAASGAFLAGSTVGALGGHLTDRLLHPVSSGLAKALGNRALPVIGLGGLAEGGQEVLETASARAAANLTAGLDRDVTEDTFGDFLLGAMGGAGAGTVGVVAEGAAERAEQSQKVLEEWRQQNNVFNAAVAAGDPSVFLDKTQPTFNPVQALRVLQEYSKREDVPAAEKVRKVEQAKEIIAQLEEDLATDKARAAEFTEEGRQARMAQIEAFRAKLKEVSPEKAETIQRVIQGMEEGLEQGARLPEDERKKILDRIQETARQLENARKVLQRLEGVTAPAAQSVTQEIAQQITQPATDTAPAPQVSASQLMTLAMNASPEQVEKILSGNHNLTPAQADALRKLSQARQQENAIKGIAGVARDVMKGGPGYKGLAQYEQEFARNLEASPALARRTLSQLRKFVADHAQKAAIANAAYDKAVRTGKTYNYVRMEDGSWTEVPALTEADRATNGGISINKKSANLVDALTKESLALTLAAEAMESLLNAYSSENTDAPEIQNQATSQPEPEAPAPAATQAAAPEVPAEPVTAGNVSTDVEQTPQVAEPTSEAAPEASVDEELVEALRRRFAEEAVAEAPAAEAETAPETEAAPETESQSEPSTDTASPEVEAQPEPEGTEAVDGRLEAIRNAETVKDWTPEDYRKGNLLSMFFRQSESKTDGTRRPLVAVKDFLSQIADGKVAFTDFLPKKAFTTELVSSAQSKTLTTFITLARKWSEKMDEMVYVYGENEQDHRYKDPLQYFLEDGKLPENVKTAISQAIFTWISEQADSSAMSDQAINEILGKPEDSPIGPLAEQYLRNAGVRTAFLASVLGSRIMQALGLKDIKNAPVNLRPVMEASLGRFAIETMLASGIAEQKELGNSVLKLLGVRNIDNDNKSYTYIRLMDKALIAAEANGEPRPSERDFHEDVVAIKQTSVRAGSVLSDLFGADGGLKLPTFEPVPYTARSIKGIQNVPRILAERINRLQSMPWKARTDMHMVVSQLGREALLRIGGIDPTRKYHKANREGQIAREEAIQRDVDHYLDFLEVLDQSPDSFDTPFYFEYFTSTPQRVYLDGNVINPQTSKVHRYLVAPAGSESRVTFRKSKKGKGYSRSFIRFQRAVAAGFGIATDKKAAKDFLPKLHALLEQPEIRQAINALKRVINDETGNALTDAEREAVIQAVQLGGEGFHTLDALQAWANYEAAWERAQNGGPAHFTTFLRAEIDGVTNGPILTQFLLGVLDTPEKLHRGGFFMQDEDQQNYNVWRGQEGSLDLYETTAAAMADALKLRQAKGGMAAETINAIMHFTRNLVETSGAVPPAARTIVKQPLTSLMFGAAVGNVVEAMGEDFVVSIYNTFEALANQEGDQTKTVREYVRSINTILQYTNVRRKYYSERKGLPYTPVDLVKIADINQAMDFTFTPEQAAAIREAFEQTVGAAMKNALETNFGVLLARRNSLNTAANLSYLAWDRLYQRLRDHEIERLVREGKIATRTQDGKQVPIHDLTYEQEEAIKRRISVAAPFVNTLMASMDNDPKSGIFLPSIKNAPQEVAGPAYSAEMKLANYSGERKSRKQGGGLKKNLSRYTNAVKKTLAEPGVRGLILMIHSTDSAIASAAYDTLKALNIHDALGVGLDEMIEAGQRLNEETFKALRDFSPSQSIWETFSSAMETLANMVERDETEFLPEAIADIRAALRRYTGDQNVRLEAFARGLFSQYQNSEIVRLKALTELGAVSQYAVEDGFYAVTDADRQSAEEKLEAVRKLEFPESLATRLNRLDEIADTVESSRIQQEAAEAEIEQLIQRSIQDAAHSQALEDVAEDPEVAEEIRKAARDLLNDQTPENPVVAEEAKAQALSRQRRNPFGLIGEPSIPSDPELESVFRKRPVITGKQAVLLLERRLNSLPASPVVQMHKALLAQIRSRLAEDLEIHYVTPDSDPEEVFGEGITNARGWYAPRTTGNRIFVKSSDFVSSGLTYELLMHELVHATLAHEIDAAQKDPNHPAAPFVQDLEGLLEAARAQARTDGTAETYANALSNVQELVAWGMTNRDFQRNVLNKVRYESRIKGRGLLEGMKGFIRALVNIIYQGSDKSARERFESGVGVLVANTAGLFSTVQKAPRTTEMTLTMAGTVQSLDPEQLFDALESDRSPVNPAFRQHLRGLVRDIIHKVRTPFELFHQELSLDPNMSPVDRFIQLVSSQNGQIFASEASSRFRIDPQTAFVLDQVEAVLAHTLDNGRLDQSVQATYRVLSRIMEEAHRVITPENLYTALTGRDYSQATPDEQREVAEQHRFLFDRSTPRSVSRFTAMALTLPEINRLLQFDSYRDRRRWKDMRWPERIHTAFTTLLDILSGVFFKQAGELSANDRLVQLAHDLVSIEARNKANLRRRDSTLGARLEDGTAALSRTIKETIKNIADSEAFRGSNNALLKGVGTVASVVAGERVGQVIDISNRLRDAIFKDRPGFVAGLINEARGPAESIHMLMLQTKNLEKARGRLKEVTAASIVEGFEKPLTPAQEELLTKIALRTDMQALLDTYSLDRIADLLASPNALNQEIRALEVQLRQNPHYRYYRRQAMDLGYFLVTGHVANPHLQRNISLIARRAGTQQVLPEAQAKAVEPLLDRLTSLYALSFTNAQARAEMADLMRQEGRREDGGNGVEFILKLHRAIQDESRQNLFEGNEALQLKGYTPALYDETVEVIATTQDEGDLLVQRGWEKVYDLPRDPHDVDQTPRALYVLRDRGLLSYQSGALSFTGRRMRGTRAHGNLVDREGNVHTYNTRLNRAIARSKAGDIAALDRTPDGYRPGFNAGKAHLVPVFNSQGEVANYVYLMSEHTKDTLLRQENRVSVVLGAFKANVFDKVSSVEQNRRVIEALKQQYDEDFKTDTDTYLWVGPDSVDPEMQEIWRMIPEETKRDIRKIWDKDGLWVKGEHLDPVFGYRKLSVTRAFDKLSQREARKLRAQGYTPQGEIRNAAEEMFVDLMSYLLGPKAELRLRAAGDMWVELVRLTKDVLTIRNLTTLLGNIMSNFTVLWVEGMGIREMLKQTRVALAGAIEYRDNAKKLTHLYILKQSGYLAGRTLDEIDREIAVLEDAQHRNPVRELIEAGLLPTIVEDVAIEDDNGNLGRLQKLLAEKTQWIPAPLKTTAKWMIVAKDTPLYQLLSNGTQLSDFVARYALYQHVTTRRKNPMSTTQAILHVSDAFVNYDIPSERGMQYLNDMGLVYFTKYYVRIQRALLRMARENPARMLTLGLLDQYFDGLQSIVDAHATLGNPLEWGAFKGLEALDEPLPIKALLALD